MVLISSVGLFTLKNSSYYYYDLASFTQNMFQLSQKINLLLKSVMKMLVLLSGFPSCCGLTPASNQVPLSPYSPPPPAAGLGRESEGKGKKTWWNKDRSIGKSGKGAVGLESNNLKIREKPVFFSQVL